MKIGILTFHCAKNYGAILQAYALHSLLTHLSPAADTTIINYRPDYLTLPYIPQFMLPIKYDFRVKNKSKEFLRRLLSIARYYIFGHKIKLAKYESFEEKYLKLNDEMISPYNFDYIIVGSDQVWNPRITNYDTAYFLKDAHAKGCKVISYAASIGIDMPTEQEISFLEANLGAIDYISVREETAARICSPLITKKVATVLDPTLLITKDDPVWLKLLSEVEEPPYLLLYQMFTSDIIYKLCKIIAKKKGLRIIEILASPLGRDNFNLHKKITTAGPAEFISLFAHADYIVTSSFHGTAFSIIFNKQFVTVPHSIVGSRQKDLLARLDLSDRVVSDVGQLPLTDIDYDKVNVLLEKEREKSIAFLEDALNIKNS